MAEVWSRMGMDHLRWSGWRVTQSWSRASRKRVGTGKSQPEKVYVTTTCYKEPEAPDGFPVGSRECMCGLPLKGCLGSLGEEQNNKLRAVTISSDTPPLLPESRPHAGPNRLGLLNLFLFFK